MIFNKGVKTIQWEKDSLFNKFCWENWITHMQENEDGPLPYTIYKNLLKMDQRHKCKR